MNRPGDRLRRLAEHVCSERMRTRLVEPALADLQAEYAEAQRRGSRWRTARSLAAGYLAIAKVLVLAACGSVVAHATNWDPAERRQARLGVWVATLAALLATVLIDANSLFRIHLAAAAGWTPDLDLVVRALLAAYLVPAVLPLSVPLGLAVGAGCTLHGAGRSCKLAIATGIVATVCSCAVFANMAWLTPESNQAFRELLITRLRPAVAFVPRGDNELTFSVLRRRLAEVRASGSRGEVRHFDTLYHGKLATSVATLPVVSVVLGLAFVRRWTRAGLMIAGVGVCAGYYAINATSLYAGSLELVSPVMAAWSANAACTLAAVYFVAVAGVTGWPGRLARRQQSFGR